MLKGSLWRNGFWWLVQYFHGSAKGFSFRKPWKKYPVHTNRLPIIFPRQFLGPWSASQHVSSLFWEKQAGIGTISHHFCHFQILIQTQSPTKSGIKARWKAIRKSASSPDFKVELFRRENCRKDSIGTQETYYFPCANVRVTCVVTYHVNTWNLLVGI